MGCWGQREKFDNPDNEQKWDYIVRGMFRLLQDNPLTAAHRIYPTSGPHPAVLPSPTVSSISSSSSVSRCTQSTSSPVPIYYSSTNGQDKLNLLYPLRSLGGSLRAASFCPMYCWSLGGGGRSRP